MIKRLGVLSAGTLLFAATAYASAPPPNNVPEPGPMGLLLVGAAGIFIARRFHKNK
jgi:hypothetical protein